jgi:hypothetical protein
MLAHVAVAAALTAAPWSAPQTLSSAHQLVDPVDVAFTAGGSGLASWTFQDGTNRAATTGAAVAGRLAGASAFSPQRGLIAAHGTDRGSALIGIVPVAAGRVLRVTLFSRHVDPRRADAFRLRSALGTTRGTFGRERLVAIGPQMLRVRLAANARGDVALAWWERAKHSRLYVAIRRHGHAAFGHPRRIAAHGFGSAAPAVGPRGDVIVAWETGGVIRVRNRGVHGTRFGIARVVTRHDAAGAELQAGITRSGRALVGWSAQRLTEGGDAGPIAYATATRAPRAQRWTATVHEREPATMIAQPVALEVEPAGRATFAWTGFDGANLRVRAATAPTGRLFADPQDVSATGADAVLGGLDAAAGERALVWEIGSPGQEGSIAAAVAPQGAAQFGAPEPVSASPTATAPRVAVDPRTRQVSAVWSDRPAPAPGAARTIARAATRSPG